MSIKELPVKCPLCHGYYATLDRTHALTHGYTSLTAFKEAQGVQYGTLAQRSRMKLKALYNIDYSRWAVVYFTSTNEARYVTKQYYKDFAAASAKGVRSASRFPLSDGAFTRHFDGHNPLAIIANGTHSRYFGFDVDTKEDALKHAMKLVATLCAQGIERDDIHVSFSGSKGYHIELFTQKHVTFEQWAQFGDYIINSAGLTGKAIEYRPERNNGRGWKLPLTYHHKTGNFAGYVDKNTYEVMDVFAAHEYLFAIRPMPLGKVLPAFARAQAAQAEVKAAQERHKAAERAKRRAVRVIDDRVFQTREEKTESADKYLRAGLVEKRTRWKVTRTLALYLYHVKNKDESEIKRILLDWTKKQIANGMAETPLDECERDIDSLIEWLPRSWGFGSIVREIEITRQEVEWILTVKNKSAQAILWALLLRSKAYSKESGGAFYTSDRDLLKMLHGMSYTTVTRWRRWLIEQGYIERWVDDYAYIRRKATNYRLCFEALGQAEVIDTIELDETMDCRELLAYVARRLVETQPTGRNERMKATMEVMTECVGFREYRTHVTVTSEKGRTLFEQYKVFKNANEVYPPYKALARGINHLPKFGVTHIDVRTNSGPLMWELTGDFNENKSLLGIVHDRLKKTGVVIDGVEGVAAA